MSDITLHSYEIETFSQYIVQNRRPKKSGLPSRMEKIVQGIIKRVSILGDKALLEYTRWFDGLDLKSTELRVKESEISNAYSKVSKKELIALKMMKSRIEKIARRTLDGLTFTLDLEGTQIAQTYRPLDEIGCYVPGGEASYPSSLLMCVVPALIAGVRRVVVCTPPKKGGINPLTLVAADLCGIKEIYQVGGAQAIAALAIGTESIQSVQKIVGPGNAYVALAKRMLLDRTLIDMPAGPSELLVIADETADPKNVALDLISQAEHSRDAISVLLSPSGSLCDKVVAKLGELIPKSQREEIVRHSLCENGGIFLCESLEACIRIANEFAPEHVQIITRDARKVAKQITSAGLILIGNYTPVAASDYCLGVNHVLPTQGYASTYSGLSVLDFIRVMRIVECSNSALEEISETICTLAEAEGLSNHSMAIRGRFE